jgi:hypothetical protein
MTSGFTTDMWLSRNPLLCWKFVGQAMLNYTRQVVQIDSYESTGLNRQSVELRGIPAVTDGK